MRLVQWLPSFILLSAIWGSSFALIKVAVEADVTPAWVALWRCLFGAVVLWAMCAGRPRLPLQVWGHAAVLALLLNAVPFALFAYGETKVSSVLAGVWNATTPLATLIFVLILVPQDRMDRRRLLGLLTGFVGVLTVLAVWSGVDGGTLAGSAACLTAAVSYGAGFAYTRRYFSSGGHSAVALAAAQITCAAAESAVLVALFAGSPQWPGRGPALALVVLGGVGTGVAFVLNLRVIQTVGPATASTVTYLIPLWSTALGAVFLSEPLGWHVFLGGLLIIIGAVLVQRPRAAAAGTPPDSPHNAIADGDVRASAHPST